MYDVARKPVKVRNIWLVWRQPLFRTLLQTNDISHIKTHISWKVSLYSNILFKLTISDVTRASVLNKANTNR